ncbi:hypothetical protein EV131_12926 [Rhizobium laguerreae]|uniref:Uncharacterized protein n=1 Tax=Rhizobium laguerreae TaxID=1076926 RepID=A0AAX2QAR3_9HYPH|nr:hypothetical protein EV131_12926 [Rhizobium laguerreae]
MQCAQTRCLRRPIREESVGPPKVRVWQKNFVACKPIDSPPGGVADAAGAELVRFQSCNSRAIGGPITKSLKRAVKPARCGEQHMTPTWTVFVGGK